MTLSPAPPASPPPELLAAPTESSSSKNSTQGADDLKYYYWMLLIYLALSNISLTLASDSPNHIVNNSGPLIEIKLAEHSLATAFANNVLPHPGGP